MDREKKPIDNVTVTNLDVALRICHITLDKKTIDLIIDLVELIEEKGDEATLMDLAKLKAERQAKTDQDINIVPCTKKA